jgi:hypothetical protein
VRDGVRGPVNDTFDTLPTGGKVADWNVYAPIWAPVSVAEFPDARNKSLKLEDRDPYDYSRAVRIFEEGKRVKLSFRLLSRQSAHGSLEIDVVDRFGNRPVRLRLREDGKVSASEGSTMTVLAPYRPDTWHRFELEVDARPLGSYSLSIDGKLVHGQAALREAVLSVERLSFRTGPFRDQPTRRTPNQVPGPDLPKAGESTENAVYHIDDVHIAPR